LLPIEGRGDGLELALVEGGKVVAGDAGGGSLEPRGYEIGNSGGVTSGQGGGKLGSSSGGEGLELAEVGDSIVVGGWIVVGLDGGGVGGVGGKARDDVALEPPIRVVHRFAGGDGA